MKTEIKLLNEYYPWQEIKLKGARCYLKGNVFLENEFLSTERLAELISSLICKEEQEKETRNFLKKLNGVFALVAETKDIIFVLLIKQEALLCFM